MKPTPAYVVVGSQVFTTEEEGAIISLETLEWLRREPPGPSDHAEAPVQPNPQPTPTTTPPAETGPLKVLCYTAKQTQQALQVSATTLWRLEKTGQLLPLPNSRHKRYPVEWVERYATGQAPHPAMARLWTLKEAPAAGKRPSRKRSA